jgi:hypothetical protein
MTFLRSLFGVAKAHPLAFVLFIIGVVLFLGGLVWFVLGKLFALLKGLPFIGGAAAKAEGAIEAASAKTGSA